MIPTEQVLVSTRPKANSIMQPLHFLMVLMNCSSLRQNWLCNQGLHKHLVGAQK